MRITCNILSLIFDFKAEEFYDLDLTCLYSFTWNTDIREFLWSGTKKGSSFYIFLLLTFYLCGRGFKVCQTLDLFDVWRNKRMGFLHISWKQRKAVGFIGLSVLRREKYIREGFVTSPSEHESPFSASPDLHSGPLKRIKFTKIKSRINVWIHIWPVLFLLHQML